MSGLIPYNRIVPLRIRNRTTAQLFCLEDHLRWASRLQRLQWARSLAFEPLSLDVLCWTYGCGVYWPSVVKIAAVKITSTRTYKLYPGRIQFNLLHFLQIKYISWVLFRYIYTTRQSGVHCFRHLRNNKNTSHWNKKRWQIGPKETNLFKANWEIV